MKRCSPLFAVCAVWLAVATGPVWAEMPTKIAVRMGADRILDDEFALVQGKRIGLVTNHSALCSNGMHVADALMAKGAKLTALFAPEHGIRGDAPEGARLADSVDARTGVRIYSLYGRVDKPTAEMLRGVDVLVFDIQDVGVRFYTYISTLFLVMESAAEHRIPVIVLDRPNPISGVYCDGPLRDDSLKTFVGWAPMPIAHGMTVGELALMANGEGWLKEGMKADLHVVAVVGWKRSLWFDELALQWVRPSPNMRTLATAAVYPGACLVEGTNVSEGRGTDNPFETIGAPWIDGDTLAAALNAKQIPGVRFEPVVFTPRVMPGVSSPKYRDEKCGGVFLRVTRRSEFKPVAAGLSIVSAIHGLYPAKLTFRERGFDRLAGTPRIRTMILAGRSVAEITASWGSELRQFTEQRMKYFLYH